MRSTSALGHAKEARAVLESVEQARSATFLRTEGAVIGQVVADLQNGIAASHGTNNRHIQSVSVGNHLMLDQYQTQELVISTKSRTNELSGKNKPHVNLRKDECHLLVVHPCLRSSTPRSWIGCLLCSFVEPLQNLPDPKRFLPRDNHLEVRQLLLRISTHLQRT
jgi:hypothetical protein